MKHITNFKDEYEFLHNYYPHLITYEGINYPTNEHAFQAAKTLDIKLRKQIAACETPGKAKELGNAIPLRPDWEAVKTGIMEEICRLKFADPTLKEQLLATEGCYLIEGNHWGDTCWGMVNGKGENRLGQILMKIRDEELADIRAYEESIAEHQANPITYIHEEVKKMLLEEAE